MHQLSEGASLPRTIGQIASLQAGRVQNLGTAGAPDPLARPWRSAFFKTALSGPVNVGTLTGNITIEAPRGSALRLQVEARDLLSEPPLHRIPGDGVVYATSEAADAAQPLLLRAPSGKVTLRQR